MYGRGRTNEYLLHRTCIKASAVRAVGDGVLMLLLFY